MSQFVPLALVLFLALSVSSRGQISGGPCPTALATTQTILLSKALVCVVPQAYGGGGLVGLANNGPLGSTDVSSAAFKRAVHFQASSLGSFAPLTEEIGTQINQLNLPVTSPSAGFIVLFNPSLGVESVTTRNLGSPMSERAQTIGRHKLVIGLSYQYFNFDRVDGVNKRSFSSVFQSEHESCPNLPTVI